MSEFNAGKYVLSLPQQPKKADDTVTNHKFQLKDPLLQYNRHETSAFGTVSDAKDVAFPETRRVTIMNEAEVENNLDNRINSFGLRAKKEKSGGILGSLYQPHVKEEEEEDINLDGEEKDNKKNSDAPQHMHSGEHSLHKYAASGSFNVQDTKDQAQEDGTSKPDSKNSPPDEPYDNSPAF